MKKFAMASWLLIVLSMPMLGCDRDEEEEGSGVNRSKVMTEVSAEEANTVCNYVVEQLSPEDVQTVFCYLIAHLVSELDPSIDCEAVAQECLASSEPLPDLSEQCDVTSQDLSALPACAATVTVGEFEDCQLATVQALADLADTISCDFAPPEEDEVVPECQNIMNECPELLNLFEGEDQMLL